MEVAEPCGRVRVTLARGRESVGEETEEGLEALMVFSKEVIEDVDQVIEAN